MGMSSCREAVGVGNSGGGGDGDGTGGTAGWTEKRLSLPARLGSVVTSPAAIQKP